MFSSQYYYLRLRLLSWNFYLLGFHLVVTLLASPRRFTAAPKCLVSRLRGHCAGSACCFFKWNILNSLSHIFCSCLRNVFTPHFSLSFKAAVNIRTVGLRLDDVSKFSSRPPSVQQPMITHAFLKKKQSPAEKRETLLCGCLYSLVFTGNSWTPWNAFCHLSLIMTCRRSLS